MSQLYIDSVKKIFLQYRNLGEIAMAQVDDNALFHQFNEDSNSIATIVKHLWGNMLSRWTDFLTTDGEKPWRQRDAEFENDIKTRAELLEKWNEGWDLFTNSLSELGPEDLTKTITIRSEPQSVTDAINRQLAHYSYHIGQIVYLCKVLKKDEWNSLTIPRNKSKEFNAEMMKNQNK